jgi:transposase
VPSIWEVGVTGVIIGIDPHQDSHTAVALDRAENELGQLRVRATAVQVDQLRRWAAGWPERTWAVEGARGLGHLLAPQLLACRERVVDVQPKLAARVRLLNTGVVNKNDPDDARSVAVAALRSSEPRAVPVEDQIAVLRLWARRYRDLGSARTQPVCRLHAVQCELVPGGFAKKSQRPRRPRYSPSYPLAARSTPHDSSLRSYCLTICAASTNSAAIPVAA